MRAIPLDVLLSWPTPNYEDPVTRGHALVVVNCIFLSLVVTIVALRLYTRLVIKRWFGADDVFIALALVFTIALTAVVLLANQTYGWDRHVYDIPINRIAPTAKIAMSAKIIFTCAASFTRLSLLFFYYRLVKDTGKQWFHWAIHANVAFTIAIFITFIFLAIFQCIPVRLYWEFAAPPDACMNEGTVTLIAGILNCVADLFCTLLPIPMVARLAMPRRQRVAVVVLFSLGFVVTIAGIVRTWFIYKSLIQQYDITWYSYPLWIAAAVEIDLGVICASAPVLRPLLSKLPFSLSTLTSKISTLKPGSGGYLSKASGNVNPSGSTLQGTMKNSKTQSATASKRRSAPITEEPRAYGQDAEGYELRQWDDVERDVRSGAESRAESHDAILGSEDSNREDVERRTGLRKLCVTANDMNTRGTMPTSEEVFAIEIDRVSTKIGEVVAPAR